ncbi:MAG: ATP-dependent sacrificial sulfur transferase LarE [Akkermansia sp.]|nr:ATP-dependent sacrificial sulfur transferase LarE [Akkermansia sp.]
MTERAPDTLLQRLRESIRSMLDGGMALAYSGGVDSTLLLAVCAELARENGGRVVALTAHTPMHSGDEIARARELAQTFGVPIEVFPINPLELEAVRLNRPDRCYHCKRALFQRFTDYADAHALRTVVEGSHADDEKAYRPGRRAIQELLVRSPLAELGFTKADVRAVSAALHLPTADAPAKPCLATRFDYGTELTDALLRRVQEGEDYLHTVLPHAADIRLRVHGDLARIELPPAQFPAAVERADTITAELKKLGFRFVTLDLQGFRSGSFDTPQS